MLKANIDKKKNCVKVMVEGLGEEISKDLYNLFVALTDHGFPSELIVLAMLKFMNRGGKNHD